MRRWTKRLAAACSAILLIGAAYGYAAWWPTCTWFGEVIVRAPATGTRPRVALTFDDGPDPTATPQVLDTLKQARVRATFFVVGQRAEQHPELIRRIVTEGHSIGNHSFDHPPLILLSRAAIEQQVMCTQTAIEGALREATTALPSRAIRWFRPPFGLRDPRVLAIAHDHGMQTILWSSSPQDWQEPEPAVIAQRVLSDLHDGAIVLLHDGDAHSQRGRMNTVAALPDLLAGIAARGFDVLSLDELLNAATHSNFEDEPR